MNPRLTEITTLGRPIDLRYPSNRLAVGVTIVTGVVAFVLSDAGGLQRPAEAAAVAIAAFLGWAVGHELDPDHPRSAGYAAVLAAVLGFFVGPPALGASATGILAGDLLLYWAGHSIGRRALRLPRPAAQMEPAVSFGQ